MRSRAFVVIGVLSTALVTGGWFFERGLDGRGSSVSGPRLFDEVGDGRRHGGSSPGGNGAACGMRKDVAARVSRRKAG